MTRTQLDIVIPLYNHPELFNKVFDSILHCSEELLDCSAEIILINDSPKSLQLREAITARLKPKIKLPVKLINNPKNLGFVKSANRAFKLAKAKGHDVLLLNSDTELYPGCVTEMLQVSQTDSMIGFVNPRSNNATIATFPQLAGINRLNKDTAYAKYKQLINYLPRVTYTPTAVGFCLLIKNFIIAEFGFFDEIFGQGFNEENDLILRANQYGYRSVIANLAYCYHKGSASFGQEERLNMDSANQKILLQNYPYYLNLLESYFNTSIFKAEKLLAGLCYNNNKKYDIVFDLTYVGQYYNGTFELASRLIANLAEINKYNIYLSGEEQNLIFHNFDKLPNITLLPPKPNRYFAAAIRLAQPFTDCDIQRLSDLAPVNIFFILDTIALDCLQLHGYTIDRLWRYTASYASGLLFNSPYTMNQFASRFPVKENITTTASYHSLNTDEYFESDLEKLDIDLIDERRSYVFFVGNNFKHKYVEETIIALAKDHQSTNFVAQTDDTEIDSSNIHMLPPGQLSNGQINTLFANSSCVIFPSHYEGFGFPIMKAIAYNKTIFVRNSPLNISIKKLLGDCSNIIIYNTTDELIELFNNFQTTKKSNNSGTDFSALNKRIDLGWKHSTNDLIEVIDQCIKNCSFNTLLERLEFHNNYLMGQQSVITQKRNYIKLIKQKIVSRMKKGI